MKLTSKKAYLLLTSVLMSSCYAMDNKEDDTNNTVVIAPNLTETCDNFDFQFVVTESDTGNCTLNVSYASDHEQQNESKVPNLNFPEEATDSACLRRQNAFKKENIENEGN